MRLSIILLPGCRRSSHVVDLDLEVNLSDRRTILVESFLFAVRPDLAGFDYEAFRSSSCGVMQTSRRGSHILGLDYRVCPQVVSQRVPLSLIDLCAALEESRYLAS